MHVRMVSLGALAATLIAAGGASTVSEADDPCGDILWASVAGEREDLAPPGWESFDLEHVSIAELGERDEGTHEVVLTFDLCGPVDEPDSIADGFRAYSMAWDLSNGCYRVVEVGWDGASITPVSGVTVSTWDLRRVQEQCLESQVGPTRVWETPHEYDLPQDALEIAGDRLIVRLRADDYPAFSDSFGPGAVFSSPRATTQASAVTAPGMSASCDSTGFCGAFEDGDRVELPDLVLSDG